MVGTRERDDRDDLEWAIALSRAALEASEETLQRSRTIARVLARRACDPDDELEDPDATEPTLDEAPGADVARKAI